VSVVVSTDGGTTWDEAELGEAPDIAGLWRGWHFTWDAVRGSHELRSRATDASGNRQPLDSEWNLGGYVNNVAQRIHVDVV
jgi:hypothetical protein